MEVNPSLTRHGAFQSLSSLHTSRFCQTLQITLVHAFGSEDLGGSKGRPLRSVATVIRPHSASVI